MNRQEALDFVNKEGVCLRHIELMKRRELPDNTEESYCESCLKSKIQEAVTVIRESGGL